MPRGAPRSTRGRGCENAGHPRYTRSNLVFAPERRYSPMRMTTDTLYFGNYRFTVEFDSGSETGTNQLNVWVAEKTDIDAVPLKQFGTAQLLSALIEPEKSRLSAAFA